MCCLFRKRHLADYPLLNKILNANISDAFISPHLEFSELLADCGAHSSVLLCINSLFRPSYDYSGVHLVLLKL